MSEAILCVDDDPRIRLACQRLLGERFAVEVAASGREGLALMESHGPFAVIVADFRMPLMDGIQFLARAKERAPDSVRLMLTGNADLHTAVQAVNEASIFRLLTKPCPAIVLINAVNAAVQQYRLIMAERELLEETLSSSVRVLTEILSLVNPVAFSRAERITRIVTDLAARLQPPASWQFQLAAMLSQIGCVTLPPEVLNKVAAREALSSAEQGMVDSYPAIGGKLLANIPRLEPVARMIEGQHRPFSEMSRPDELTREQATVELGAQILKIALDLDQLLVHDTPYPEALSILRRQPAEYNPQLVLALEDMEADLSNVRRQLVSVKDLIIGMVLDEDVWARNQQLLVPMGQPVTLVVQLRLRNFAAGIGVVEPFRVRMPT
jgi:response regulator RpfG family c-di-GMP phosphodiesterase